MNPYMRRLLQYSQPPGMSRPQLPPLPELLPLLPTKPPATDEGAQFDMSFEPLGGDYAAKYYQQAFKGLLPQVQSSAPLDSMETGISPSGMGMGWSLPPGMGGGMQGGLNSSMPQANPRFNDATSPIGSGGSSYLDWLSRLWGFR